MGHIQNVAYKQLKLTPHFKSNDQNHYVGNLTFEEYLDFTKEHFDFVSELLDAERTRGEKFLDYVDFMNEISWEFEDQGDGGRGNAYNVAQKASDNRRNGTLALLRCFSDDNMSLPEKDKIILDVLDGDGTISRFLNSENIKGPTIISADLSNYMVKSCLKQKLPCIRQSATRSLFKDSSLDGVLIAYGSHHLDYDSRALASKEAYRTIKSGSKFVLHDFEVGKPAAIWFDNVVHPFSRTGHDHPHFTRDEMNSLLRDAGFKDVNVFSLSDPFILRGETVQAARKNALMHLYYMYDLIRISDNKDDLLDELEKHVNATLGKITYNLTANGVSATIPREALVAVGTK